MNTALIPGTPHNFPDAQAAWNQGKFGFWPKFKTEYSMGYYTRDEIPFQYVLAKSFTICDATIARLRAALIRTGSCFSLARTLTPNFVGTERIYRREVRTYQSALLDHRHDAEPGLHL